MAMKFACVMCGSKEARVGSSISLFKFLDQKSSHRGSERVVGPLTLGRRISLGL